MPNHLINENSPYLLQHATNPVEWYPWGQEALARARGESKPIFLSIGYAACHWCHVMEHESFEDARTADIMNEHFISIKVDREQRPDLDSIYMRATTALTGSGGWPMSVFLTPELHPFYAGTYFPPVRRYGMPAFTELLLSVARAWRENPDEIERVAAKVVAQIASTSGMEPTDGPTRQSLEEAAAALVDSSDHEHGGWGGAPKFPQPMAIEFLLRRAAEDAPSGTAGLAVAISTLKAMARGGMYDVVGSGFSRYSTDEFWHVPHFEKMLYDNAQLSSAYLHAWQITGETFYKSVALGTLDFVLREMTHASGGFYSSLDADSEGMEGRYYTWTLEELRTALDDEPLFEVFVAAYGVTERGNWEGRTVLQRSLDDASLASRFKTEPAWIAHQLAECHARLYRTRAGRVRPATDDKVLTGWNGLMLGAFAEAARCLDDEARRSQYLQAAVHNADFLLTALRPMGHLRRTWRNGVVGEGVFLEDYSALVLGLLALYQSDFDDRWFVAARELADEMIQRFGDPDGGFFDSPADAERLLVRPKDLQDNAVPSGNALACEALLRLGALTGVGSYRDRAERALRLVGGHAARFPTAFARWLSAAEFALRGDQQLALLYTSPAEARPFLNLVNSAYRPNLVIAASTFPPSKDAPELLADRPLQDRLPTAYLCRNFVCNLPVTTAEDLQRLL